MMGIDANNPLLGILGEQELIVILLYLGIPVFLIVLAVRLFKKIVLQNRASAITQTAVEIEKLFGLLQKGAITQQEFDSRKTLVLK